MEAGVHRRPHHLSLTGGGGVRGRQGRAVRAQDRTRPAGPVDRGGQGQVRPRGHRGRTPGRRRGRALRHRHWPRSASTAGSGSRATSTWPTPWTSRPRSPPTPTTSSCSARPSRWTYAARIAVGNLARNQHTLDLATSDARPSPGRAASVRWCCTSTSNRPPSAAPAGSRRLQETRGPITAEQVRDLVRQPRRPDHRPTRPRPRRAPPRRLLPSLRAAQAPDPAPRRHLRLRVLLPPRRGLRLRTPRPHDPERDDGGPTCTLQPGPVLPTPPPRQDHRRLDLRHRRTRRLPVAQPAGLPVPQRPHRHPRRHPRPRTPPTRPRVPRATSATPTPNPDHPAPHPAHQRRAGTKACPWGGPGRVNCAGSQTARSRCSVGL